MGHHNQDTHHSELFYYEGDQSKLYSGLRNHHAHDSVDSVGSKAQIKKIWRITLYLTLITLVELAGGFYEYFNEGTNRIFMITFFFFFTLWKAYLIVKVFMHLGDEAKHFVNIVLAPLILFSWFIGAFLADADFSLFMNTEFWQQMKDAALGITK
jgi:cytochrome c oxidase subunit 4